MQTNLFAYAQIPKKSLIIQISRFLGKLVRQEV